MIFREMRNERNNIAMDIIISFIILVLIQAFPLKLHKNENDNGQR